MREISEEELKNVLESHKLWLESDGDRGERACFIDLDLSKLDFIGDDFIGSCLSNESLRNSYFRSANFDKPDWI